MCVKLGRVMPAYRCYFLDEKGRIKAVEFIEADRVADAVAEGRRLLAERPQHRGIEIWDRGTKLYPD